MSFDVFVSYARQDEQVCDAIRRTLNSFGLHVFVDRYSLGPDYWTDQLGAVLQQEVQPIVLVLASTSATTSKWVETEVRLARLQGLEILVIGLDLDAVDALGLSERQKLDLHDHLSSNGHELNREFVARLWLALRYRIVRGQVEDSRERARAWARQMLPLNRLDFWGSDWQSYVLDVADRGVSRALTARGGSGKSVVTARLIDYVLRRSKKSCPVLVAKEHIAAGLSEVCKLICASSPDVLNEHLYRLREEGHEVLFVIDGLDQLVGDVDTARLRAVISMLCSASSLLVTCRSEIWEQAFDGLPVEQVSVRPLSIDTVRSVLGQPGPVAPDYLSLLRVPFYLDIARNLSEPTMTRTETDLLYTLRDSYAQPIPTGVPGQASLEPALDRLALLQLKLMAYDVPQEEYRLIAGSDSAVQLEQRGALVVRTVGMALVVRLNHDLLDAFGIAKLLIDPNEGIARRRQLYANAADELGFPLLSMLVQIAYDTRELWLLREVFEAMLYMLDRKRFGDDWMGRSWSATYVLRDKFTILAPLLLECLEGAPLSSLNSSQSPAGSRLGPNPMVTQEAASSLASAFIDLDDWQLPDAGRTISTLATGLRRWHLRKRFIEALGRYRCADALEALGNFAESELTGGGDLSVMGELAEAIGRIGESLAGSKRERAAEILGEIAKHPDVGRRAERAAISRRNRLAAKYYAPVPPIEESEIIEHLTSFDIRGGYSDWRIVKRYAEHAFDRLLQGKYSQELVDALLGAFVHQHTFVRVSVARCLAVIDDPRCRAALFEELVKPTLAADVRKACLEAIERQIDGAGSVQLRAARRWQALLVAQRLEGLATNASGILRQLSVGADDGLLVTEGAIELLPGSAALRAAPARVSVEVMRPMAAETVDETATQLIEAEDLAAVGPGIERKFCLAGIERASAHHLLVRLVEATWEQGAAFHRAIRRRAANHELLDQMLESRLRRSQIQPGIASVHAIVLTRDSRVLLARRSKMSHYAPGSWSVSFEEQVTSVDLEGGPESTLARVASRGLREEFRYFNKVDVKYITAILEMPILNAALVVLARIEQDESQFIQESRSVVGQEDPENTEIKFVDASPDVLRRVATDTSLHPTSATRLHLLARLLDDGEI